jgi:hypothetical protein
MEKGEVLLFKEMSWQTVRIEAKSTVCEELTPLRSFSFIISIFHRIIRGGHDQDSFPDLSKNFGISHSQKDQAKLRQYPEGV